MSWDTSGTPEEKPTSQSRFEIIWKVTTCKYFGRGKEERRKEAGGSKSSRQMRVCNTGRKERRQEEREKGERGTLCFGLAPLLLLISTLDTQAWQEGARSVLSSLCGQQAPGATGISGLHSRRTRGDRHSSRVEAKKPALLSSLDGYLLELTGWTQGIQAS